MATGIIYSGLARCECRSIFFSVKKSIAPTFRSNGAARKFDFSFQRLVDEYSPVDGGKKSRNSITTATITLNIFRNKSSLHCLFDDLIEFGLFFWFLPDSLHERAGKKWPFFGRRPTIGKRRRIEDSDETRLCLERKKKQFLTIHLASLRPDPTVGDYLWLDTRARVCYVVTLCLLVGIVCPLLINWSSFQVDLGRCEANDLYK